MLVALKQLRNKQAFILKTARNIYVSLAEPFLFFGEHAS